MVFWLLVLLDLWKMVVLTPNPITVALIEFTLLRFDVIKELELLKATSI